MREGTPTNVTDGTSGSTVCDRAEALKLATQIQAENPGAILEEKSNGFYFDNKGLSASKTRKAASQSPCSVSPNGRNGERIFYR